MKLENNVIIPVSLVFELDDVGWHDGRDLRLKGQASRSGIPRDHAVEDYEVLDLIGKAIDSKITVAIPLADWDKDNFLRGEVGITHDPYGWNRAESINLDYSRKCFDVLENSKYLEYACHGLLHGVYDEKGKRINEHDFTVNEYLSDGSRITYPVDNLKRRIELYFKIYESWGFKKPCEIFIVGCGCSGITEETIDKMTSVIRSYGFKYWANSGFPFDTSVKVYNGVACLLQRGKREKNHAPWNAYDVDPCAFDDFVQLGDKKDCSSYGNVFGHHWTNVLRFNPKKNVEAVPLWKEYFDRQKKVFGSVMAQDFASSVNQQFYVSYAKTEFSDDRVTVDLSGLEGKKLDCHKNEFLISLKNGLSPARCIGGAVKLVEQGPEFSTYMVTHTDTRVEILFKY